MDDGVIRAMARWPDVPAVFGWLSLDRRGRWRLRGETISNAAALAFIDRNYDVDDAGRWYFQNGPQRVYVALERAPWVLRLEPDGRLTTHTGAAVEHPRSVWVDDGGDVLVEFERGIGLLDDRDLQRLGALLRGDDGDPLDDDEAAARLDALVDGERRALSVAFAGDRLPVEPVRAAEIPSRFGFDPAPAGNEADQDGADQKA